MQPSTLLANLATGCNPRIPMARSLSQKMSRPSRPRITLQFAGSIVGIGEVTSRRFEPLHAELQEVAVVFADGCKTA
jgi:hypothetical protein